ncbi:sensor histidine kinase [Terriglobus saanensis]|uniref:histidine kinase n=1 Tax=Terriglobus saanensis (strain ATCC BAA-1853 / DSM 23119 / SP1PR4) TaxID=401053 RepID=E8V0A1_TERSS|nr:ATP-binding protein [Terriglobus saanensis]ADV83319.1 multi-sensor signal transduction histidine kinase [Terriglobus saanensis SP1PR4]
MDSNNDGQMPSSRTRLPLGKSPRRRSFENRMRASLFLLSLPALALCILVGRDLGLQWLGLSVAITLVVIFWWLAVLFLMDQIKLPLQTLANVVAALREEDYSFRARGGRRDDALGDLALEVNALANQLQGQKTSVLETMALLEIVMGTMQSPVFAFDPAGDLKLLNAAAESAFGLDSSSLGKPAVSPALGKILQANDGELLSSVATQPQTRWVVKRSHFRLRGVPHTLVVLSDVSAALRDEERLAWERLIRVLGHEINNSLTPIKSIAGTLRSHYASKVDDPDGDFSRGLEVIEDRAESLNRFLQAYRELMGLPAPRRAETDLALLLQRVALLERRLEVSTHASEGVFLLIDADQIEQALINLIRNAADSALGAAPARGEAPRVELAWQRDADEVLLTITDNGSGIANTTNLFVPFYTTKPNGSGIGLVLAQQIAEAHGGTVRLTNLEGEQKGCRAEVRLPFAS